MKHALTFLLLFGMPVSALAAEVFTIHPISHASFVLEAGGKTIYVDPVGEADAYHPHPPGPPRPRAGRKAAH